MLIFVIEYIGLVYIFTSCAELKCWSLFLFRI